MAIMTELQAAELIKTFRDVVYWLGMIWGALAIIAGYAMSRMLGLGK